MTSMELTILGTSSMVPTKERNVSAYFLKLDKEGILLDCGEGTQRQMNIAGIKRTSVTKILISHWHGDHVSGIIGLLQTIGNEEPEVTIQIHGPKETKKRIEHMLQTCIFENKIALEIFEHTDDALKTILETPLYKIVCAPMAHSVPCIGYSIIIKDSLRIDTVKTKKLGLQDGTWMKEVLVGKTVKINGKEINSKEITKLKKGKKITYIPDTTPHKFIPILAQEADVMLIESTYAADLNHKAEEYQHLTAHDAASLAQQASVKKLILTHFSQRYKQTDQILDDAKMIFPNTVCAHDFMKVKI